MTKKENAIHETAVAALREYHSSGQPFVLYLSSWVIDEALEVLDHILGKKSKPGKIQARIGLERQIRILLNKEIGVKVISIYRQGDSERIVMPEEWPAFFLSDEDWEAKVRELASLADMIVLDWGISSDSLAKELDICSEIKNAIKSVIIINATPEQIWLRQFYKIFPRIVPLNEMPAMTGLHPEFFPLMERIEKISRLAPEIRKKYADTDLRLRSFPMPPTFDRFVD